MADQCSQQFAKKLAQVIAGAVFTMAPEEGCWVAQTNLGRIGLAGSLRGDVRFFAQLPVVGESGCSLTGGKIPAVFFDVALGVQCGDGYDIMVYAVASDHPQHLPQHAQGHVCRSQ